MHVTSRCSTTPALRAYVGQFLSRGFMVLLRKSIPQNHIYGLLQFGNIRF